VDEERPLIFILGPLRIHVHVHVSQAQVELAPGVDFTNMFALSSYTHMSQKAQKDTYGLTVSFEYLGSLGVKAAHKILLKLTSKVRSQKSKKKNVGEIDQRS